MSQQTATPSVSAYFAYQLSWMPSTSEGEKIIETLPPNLKSGSIFIVPGDYQ
jgi:hypothetical protein